ncbi:MAG: hypothetical protein ACRDY7_17475 [Acidimicrobiia bacterium]
MSRGNGSGTITRGDIEQKLAAIRDSLEPVGEQAKVGLKAAIPVIALVAVAAAYLIGRKGGKQRRAVIEIRRV